MPQIGQLIFPRVEINSQLVIPFWPQSAGIIIGIDSSLSWDKEEQTPLEKRDRYIVFVDNNILYFSLGSLKQAYATG